MKNSFYLKSTFCLQIKRYSSKAGTVTERNITKHRKHLELDTQEKKWMDRKTKENLLKVVKEDTSGSFASCANPVARTFLECFATHK